MGLGLAQFSVQNKSTGFTSLSGLLSLHYEAQPPPHLRDPGSLPGASLPPPGGGGEGQEISSGGDGVHHPRLVQLQQPLQVPLILSPGDFH